MLLSNKISDVIKPQVCDELKNDDFNSINETDGELQCLRLKGQMIHLPDEKCILFLCSPRFNYLINIDNKNTNIILI